MKNLLITIVTAITFVLIIGYPLNGQAIDNRNSVTNNENFTVPNNVMAILDNSCLQCHGTDGKFKAKMKWNFDKMKDMDNSKLISKLSKIEDILTKSKMPPKKFLKKNPNHKLTEENREVMINWASSLAEEITKK